jgi:hypothetical protein
MNWKHYGGRGIEFRFSSVKEAGLWIMQNLGLHKELELDRINTNGHYEPGNLVWATGRENKSHTRATKHVIRFHEFKARHPEVRYADSTLRQLISKMTDEEIVARWNAPSCKPKGVYGTYSMPDPAIVLRCQADSSQIVATASAITN